MKKKYLIIGNKRNYTIDLFKQEDVDIDFSYYNINIFFKIIRRIWFLLCKKHPEIWYSFKKKFLRKYDVIILFECTYPLEIIEYIRKRNTKCKLIYWLWNSVDKMGKSFMYDGYTEFCKILKLRKEKNFEVWSFDKKDCKYYGLKYNNQVAMNLNLEETSIKRDIFFCGMDKGRIVLLMKLSDIFKENNISYEFLILANKGKKYNYNEKKYIIYEPLEYKKVIEKELESKCILDIVQEGQGGITWRPLEAMFYKKKLVTNYKNIKEYDFYNKNNIFIIGIDDMKNIKDFLERPYENISKEIINKYLAKGWLDNFMKDCDDKL